MGLHHGFLLECGILPRTGFGPHSDDSVYRELITSALLSLVVMGHEGMFHIRVDIRFYPGHNTPYRIQVFLSPALGNDEVQ